jgi:hypothetical protein
MRPWRIVALPLLIGIVAGAAGAPRDLWSGEKRPPIVLQSDRLEPPAVAAGRDDSLKLATTDMNNMRLVVSNAATFGAAFNSRQVPSMEWPARSGIDHLVRGALWVGAVSVATGDTLVSTGGRDAYYLDPIFAHSEYTPTQPKAPQEYSRLRTSPFYRPGTISDENLHTTWVDTIHVVKTVAGEERHTPMGIRVIQNTYDWGFDPVDDFVIVEFNVVNTSDAALQNMWIGIYSELVTNNRNFYRTWPPGGIWFDYQDLVWDDAERLLLCHNVRGTNTGATQWGGIKVLGCGGHGATGRGPDSIATKQLTMTAWSWSPTRFYTWTDDSLYTFMSRARTDWPTDPVIPDPNNTEVNPVTIIAVGPLGSERSTLLAPADTVQVVFAFLAGEDEEDIRKNAFWAQKAYDDKYALPSPPSSPIMRVFPHHQGLTLRWSDDPETEPDPATKLVDFQGYRVYLSESPLAAQFHLAHQYDIRDGIGFDTGIDAVRRTEPFIDADGDTLEYEVQIDGVPDGFKRYVAVTSYDYQVGEPHSLEGGVIGNSVYCIAGPDAAAAAAGGHKVSVFPNPYRGESAFDVRNPDGSVNPRKRVLWFVNLPPRAHLKIYTLAGDIVREYDYDAATYTGAGAAGVSPDRSDLAVGRLLVTGGSMLAYDLLNQDGQEIASGLYLFAVRDKDTGDTQQGKFLIIR